MPQGAHIRGGLEQPQTPPGGPTRTCTASPTLRARQASCPSCSSRLRPALAIPYSRAWAGPQMGRTPWGTLVPGRTMWGRTTSHRTSSGRPALTGGKGLPRAMSRHMGSASCLVSVLAWTCRVTLSAERGLPLCLTAMWSCSCQRQTWAACHEKLVMYSKKRGSQSDDDLPAFPGQAGSQDARAGTYTAAIPSPSQSRGMAAEAALPGLARGQGAHLRESPMLRCKIPADAFSWQIKVEAAERNAPGKLCGSAGCSGSTC